MIKLYTNHGSTSSRFVKNFLNEYKYEYEERCIAKSRLSCDEIKNLLLISVDGTTDIVSERSKAFKRVGPVDDLTINELIKLIQDNPTLLKVPILVDGTRLIVGYDEEELERYKR